MKFVARLKAGVAAFFAKQTLSPVDNSRGWFPLFGFSSGDFQTDTPATLENVLSVPAVFSCVTLISSDIGKLALRLMAPQNNIWTETNSSSFSPVLRKPNPWQTRQQFIETWVLSKLLNGNSYILKVRDRRQVVTAMYVLDHNRVTPLVAPDGSVFYDLRSDDLAQVPDDIRAAPASEIIHDRMNCLFHPLVGVSPIYACGLAASQALNIMKNSEKFFKNMSRPSGILTAPGQISDETAKRLKDHWEANYSGEKIGKVAVLGDDLKYSAMSVNAVDAQLVEQLKDSAAQICSTLHVPAFKIGAGTIPAGQKVEDLNQIYYADCLQALMNAIEDLIDEGLGLTAAGFRSEFDLDDLLRMDSKTLAEVEGAKTGAAIASPNEARRKFNLPPVTGGETPYLQQQNYSLAALAKRDAQADPFATAAPPAPPAPAEPEDTEEMEEAKSIIQTAKFIETFRKGLLNV